MSTMAKEQEFQLYNSMTKQKEIFVPKEPGKVGMYVCGVTAYDLSHIGHARAYVAFDILFRYLKHLGYEVNYVRNFTDVDDKIIRRANELEEDPLALSSRYCEEFLIDMVDLQCLPPTYQPRVSDHMEQIKGMIAQIISNGCAYEMEGDVYFSVEKFPSYGQLSGRKLEDNRAGERVAVDTRKRNPADFALWKAAKPGEPSWGSPWGPGRPGWHIECSAMSAHYLTYSFDIHGGGMDLIFPHHENELAQSCAACPDCHVKYWVHNGFVTANDEKMSKSLGNFFTIREVTKLYHPLALRHFLMSTHYRSPVNYSIQQIEIASEAVYYIYQTLQDCEDALLPFQQGSQEGTENGKIARITPAAKDCISKLRDDFETKLSDDLHTPYILNAALQEALRFTNSSMNLLKKKQPKQQQLSLVQSLTELGKEVKKVLSTLGLLAGSTYSEVLQQLKDKALKRSGLTEEGVLHLIEERAMARNNKDFNRGDEIRSELAAKGIALMDVGKETIWRPCVPPEQPSLPVQKEQPSVPDKQEEQVVPVST
ncbi:cysteine--tRNA ligase 2, cytoplasmic [Rhododendron vialii]|uniref:cysteine--tRNA ligase 2, cytoplasmic n=1 Tax=Rhododendron vialii TaxID=182163 RepID=UPI00265EC1D8|nr:cysteine--tRNA ligase 2, cytoplasmic [Rhododendron vialii]